MRELNSRELKTVNGGTCKSITDLLKREYSAKKDYEDRPWLRSDNQGTP